MWRCALVLALAAPIAGFGSRPKASDVDGRPEVPAAVREAVERYAADPTDANLQAAVDLSSDSGRASRAYVGWKYARTEGAYCKPPSYVSSYVTGSMGEAEAACDADPSCGGFTLKTTKPDDVTEDSEYLPGPWNNYCEECYDERRSFRRGCKCGPGSLETTQYILKPKVTGTVPMTSFNPSYECYEKKDLSQFCDEFCAELLYRQGIMDAVPHLDNNWNYLLAFLDAQEHGCVDYSTSPMKTCPIRSDRVGRWAQALRKDTCYSPLECIYYHNPSSVYHRRRNMDVKPECSPTCLTKASAVTREAKLLQGENWLPDVVQFAGYNPGGNRYYKAAEVNGKFTHTKPADRYFACDGGLQYTPSETAAYHTCAAHYHELGDNEKAG